MLNSIVLDLETKNTFLEVGRDNFDALDISLIGVYSYNKNEFIAYEEHEIEDFIELLRGVSLIIGFSINRFDIPVLKKHAKNLNLFSIPRLDLLDEIEFKTGKRVGLNNLAKANLGLEKTHHGLEAPNLYREGNIEELKNYCLNDVKITKELYELAKRQGHLLVPKRGSDELEKVELLLNRLPI